MWGSLEQLIFRAVINHVKKLWTFADHGIEIVLSHPHVEKRYFSDKTNTGDRSYS